MKPDRIVLLRHGESKGNVDKTIYQKSPDYTIELTDNGHKQATEAGQKLHSIIGDGMVQFYVSPFWRTRQTFLNVVRAFSPACIRYYEDPRLREQEWSPSMVERADAEKARDAYGHFYYRFHGGESCADVYDRMSDFMGTLHRDFKKPDFPRNVVIVTHGMAIRCFIMRFFHCSVEEFESWANPWNCEYLLLERDDYEKYKLVTPMRLHQIRHEYQFNWEKWTDTSTNFGRPHVPYVK